MTEFESALADAWEKGFEAAYWLARGYGHPDGWGDAYHAGDWPKNPYSGEDA